MAKCICWRKESFIISLDFLFKNNRHFSVGFILILIGLFIKIVFAHHYSYWVTVKISSLAFFSIGLYVASLRFFSTKKPKGSFADTFFDKILYNIATVFFLVFSLIFIVMLENIAKEVNFSIRNFYLDKNTEQKKAIIVDGERLSVLKTGSDEFYTFLIKTDNVTTKQGLLVDYIKKDFDKHHTEESIVINGKRLRVQDLLGKRVIVEVSKKHPTFFKLVSLD